LEIATLLRADTELMTLLPGGLYTDEEVGVEGIQRGDDSPTEAAFDASGFLLTCAVVREDALIPISGVRSLKSKFAATSQMVYIYFYERRGKTEIALAKHRTYEILEGERLSDSYEIWWEFETPAYIDMGPVANSTALRQDWRVTGLRTATP
jgi:hypothetical protein